MLEARLSAAAVAGSARAPDATAPSTAGVGCLSSAAAVDALVRGAMVEKSLQGEQTARSRPRELRAAPRAAFPAASPRGSRGHRRAQRGAAAGAGSRRPGWAAGWGVAGPAVGRLGCSERVYWSREPTEGEKKDRGDRAAAEASPESQNPMAQLRGFCAFA